MPQTPEEESLGSLVAQASSHISSLIRSEIELAKAEFRFDAKRVGTAAGMFAAAAFMAHLCLILASFTIAYALAQVMPNWLAFLIVTVFYLLVAGLLVFVGIRRLKGLAGMKRTARSIKGLKEIATPEEPALPVPSPDREPVTRDGA
ncbi:MULTISPECIES: phage holin family protein [unclassified Nonomuraea]|uniref:phage holin family protein n=1 Tax=unclassified Nonomuraea TaxID=2593643 RepID=UPI0034463848